MAFCKHISRPFAHHWRRLAGAIALSGLCFPVMADEAGDVRWNGFLNVVGGIMRDEPRADFSGVNQKPSYQGYTSDLRFEPHTSAGLQARKRLDKTTEVTAQLYSEGDIDNYSAKMKWLYLTWEPSSHSSVRIGKIGTPLYYHSDHLNIGYAYHWVTPPEAVYPFDTSMTGLSYTYTGLLAGREWRGEIYAGNANEYLPLLNANLELKNTVGGSLTFEANDWLTLRASGLRADAYPQSNFMSTDTLAAIIENPIRAELAKQNFTSAQIDALTPLVVQETLARVDMDELLPTELTGDYWTMAVLVETGNWLFMAEGGGILSDTYTYSDVHSGFVSAARRFNETTVHVTLSDGQSRKSSGVRRDLAFQLPENPQLGDYAEAVNARLGPALAGIIGRNSTILNLGVRHELSENLALKADIMRLNEKPLFDGDTYGTGYNNIFRVAINATF